jgi:hypothetical protein
MKYIVILLFVLFGLTSCKKSGVINHRLRFTNTELEEGAGKVAADTFHAQFGTLITTVTPYSFTSKLNILAYQDDLEPAGSGADTRSISYIDGHDNDPNYQIFLDVDFSNNQEFTAEPILYGTDIRDGIFEQDEVTMNHFVFVPYHITLSFVMPLEYKDVQFELQELNTLKNYDPLLNRVTLTCNDRLLTLPLYGQQFLIPAGYVFGGTDSTYIHNPQALPNLPGCPFSGLLCNNPFIRSSHYTPVTVTMPDGGESIEMFSTVSFNSDNLVQIYAGNDGVAYTGDDVFVYAPKYWERVVTRLEVR